MSSSSERRRPSAAISGGPGWADLAEDHLVDILGRLHSLQDFFAVRAVCRSWRNAAKPSLSTLSSQSPLLPIARNKTESLYDIAARRPYHFKLPWAHPHRFTIGYSQGQLITSTPFDEDGSNNASILLRDLFTGALTLLPLIPHNFGQVILSARPESTHCLVILFQLDNDYIQFINVGDTCWTVERSACLIPVQAMTFFQGELLALTEDMELLAVELAEKPLRVRKLGGGGDFDFDSYWLGECDGVLLAVADCYLDFKVFQWNSEKKGWEEIHDLGDKALFISYHGDLVSISSTGSGLRKNCVYLSFNTKGWLEFSLEDRSWKEGKVDYPHEGLDLVWVFPNKYREMDMKEHDRR